MVQGLFLGSPPLPTIWGIDQLLLKNYEIFMPILRVQRRYSQSGNDWYQMVEVKKSRISCYIFSIFINNLIQRRYSQSGNDRDEMVEIKKSRVSCYIFSIFMNNLIQWRKSEAGLPKLISDFVSNPNAVLTSLCLLNKILFKYAFNT